MASRLQAPEHQSVSQSITRCPRLARWLKRRLAKLRSWLHIGEFWAGPKVSGGWVLCFNYIWAVLDRSSIDKTTYLMVHHESYSWQ